MQMNNNNSVFLSLLYLNTVLIKIIQHELCTPEKCSVYAACGGWFLGAVLYNLSYRGQWQLCSINRENTSPNVLS